MAFTLSARGWGVGGACSCRVATRAGKRARTDTN
eukprot:COSAG02_NODE_16735_length_1059_cov_9.134375_1_plen_33_part_10